MTTTASRKTPFTLVVALCPMDEAEGQLYWDDGDQVELTRYITAQYTASVSGGSGQVSATTVASNLAAEKEFAGLLISSVVVVGKDLENATQGSYVIDGAPILSENVIFTPGKLTFLNVEVSITKAFKLQWS